MPRKPVDTTPLPPVSDAMADRIHTFLAGKFDMKRPPEVAARLLALIVELHKRDLPYPPRAAVAEHIDASPFGLDAAINRAMERELITVAIRTSQGSINSRTSVVQQKHYVPSDDLLHAAQAKPRMFGRRRVA